MESILTAYPIHTSWLLCAYQLLPGLRPGLVRCPSSTSTDLLVFSRPRYVAHPFSRPCGSVPATHLGILLSSPCATPLPATTRSRNVIYFYAPSARFFLCHTWPPSPHRNSSKHPEVEGRPAPLSIGKRILHNMTALIGNQKRRRFDQSEGVPWVSSPSQPSSSLSNDHSSARGSRFLTQGILHDKFG